MGNGTEKYWEYWRQCILYIEENNQQQAAKYAKDTARQLGVSETLIKRIFAVNLSSYSAKIDSHMEQCIQRAKDEQAQALCLYYSMDNGWGSTIYICNDFYPNNNSWITASRSWVDIGKARSFSGIYKKEAKSAFLADDISTGICILLMVRTSIAFQNVADKYTDCGLKICMTCTESDFVQLV